MSWTATGRGAGRGAASSWVRARQERADDDQRDDGDGEARPGDEEDGPGSA